MRSFRMLRNVTRIRALSRLGSLRKQFPGHVRKLTHCNYCHYDLVVIGGGPGGLAAAKEASSLGARAAVVDYEASSPIATSWRPGGSCVHVGDIPKKLMHQAALLGEALHDARGFGWRIDNKIDHNWKLLQDALQSHDRSVNSQTKLDLRDRNVNYLTGKGSFEDPYTLDVATPDEQDNCKLTAKYFLIAVGGRPRYPNIPGALDYGITSDDIFTSARPPGKTIVVGSGYIGVECAGALNVLGYDTTVMVRSIPLRGLDQQMATIVTDEMKQKGVKFLCPCVPTAIDKLKSGKLKVDWKNAEENQNYYSGEFDTVMFAIGRRALTDNLNLENAGIRTTQDGNKIETLNEQTNVPHIYAVGDVVHGRPELTPVAIHAGKLLSRRLFCGSEETMDYESVASTVFTPLEYGFVGLSEETALQRFGEANVEVYHSFYKPPEFGIAKKNARNCYLKVIAMREGHQKVLGMHFVGPLAGEVIQGFAIAMKCNLTIDSLVNTVGIHPTLAEEFTRITITKRSGRDPSPASCCS